MSELTVYIDEGGDSGVKDGIRYFGTRHEWFTLAAYIVRSRDSAQLVDLRNSILDAAKLRQVSELHYYKLKKDRKRGRDPTLRV